MAKKIKKEQLNKIKASLRQQLAEEAQAELENQPQNIEPDQQPQDKTKFNSLNDVKLAVRKELQENPEKKQTKTKKLQEIKNKVRSTPELNAKQEKVIKWNHEVGDLVIITSKRTKSKFSDNDNDYGIIVAEDVDKNDNGTGSHAVHFDRTLFLVMSPSGNHWHFAKSLAVCK